MPFISREAGVIARDIIDKCERLADASFTNADGWADLADICSDCAELSCAKTTSTRGAFRWWERDLASGNPSLEARAIERAAVEYQRAIMAVTGFGGGKLSVYRERVQTAAGYKAAMRYADLIGKAISPAPETPARFREAPIRAERPSVPVPASPSVASYRQNAGAAPHRARTIDKRGERPRNGVKGAAMAEKNDYARITVPTGFVHPHTFTDERTGELRDVAYVNLPRGVSLTDPAGQAVDVSGYSFRRVLRDFHMRDLQEGAKTMSFSYKPDTEIKLTRLEGDERCEITVSAAALAEAVDKNRRAYFASRETEREHERESEPTTLDSIEQAAYEAIGGAQDEPRPEAAVAEQAR